MVEKKGSEGAILARLLMTIFNDLGLTGASNMSRLVDKYIERVKRYNAKIKNIPGRKPISTNKAHIMQSILTDNMSWKNFMAGIFKILNVKKMEIRIRLHHSTGVVTEHDYTIVNKGGDDEAYQDGDDSSESNKSKS